MHQIKNAYRCTWLKVFHHNVNKGKFANETEALFSLSEEKFSILGLINDKYKIDGKFEFLLEFPNLTNRQGLNRWAQSHNPLDIEEIPDTNVEGYEPITMSWPLATDLNGQKQPFCGLARSSKSSITLLDGSCSKEGYWFFSLGLVTESKSIPGDNDYNKETILWMRVDRLHSDIYVSIPRPLIVICFMMFT